MLHYIVYKAVSTEEIYQCAYSLLKYLDLYNLKPSPQHKVIIFTPQPALLEAYGSFFPHFEFRNPDNATGEPKAWLRNQSDANRKCTLYMSNNAYVAHPLESFFEKLEGLDKFAVDPAPWVAKYDDLREFNLLLKSFFRKYSEESVPNQVKLLHHTDAAQIQTDKQKFQKLPLPVRLMRNLAGRGWKISTYTKKL